MLDFASDHFSTQIENAAIEVFWAAQWLRYPGMLQELCDGLNHCLLTAKGKYEIPEKRVEGDTKVTIVKHEPLGLVAAICPWNCTSARLLLGCDGDAC